uniref:Uncharacterized protein n=1 Tax=Arundo donax TaxID=35708 RepID=A0A0A9BZI8_ARUDO
MAASRALCWCRAFCRTRTMATREATKAIELQ